MIITCDSHYVYPWQSDSHAKLVLVNTGGFINKKAKNEASLTDTKNDESQTAKGKHIDCILTVSFQIDKILKKKIIIILKLVLFLLISKIQIELLII